ncbi:MAG: DUF5723 family protein, partial [Bacteroidales bacterium]|nr:DUF5723 family protein [Bacteroidales bacterium]
MNIDMGIRMNKIVRITVLPLLFGMWIMPSDAQISRAAWFMEDLPASNILNPAHHPKAKIYFNLPVISSFYLGFESPFSFNDLTTEWPGGDSLYINRDKVMSRLKDRNYFNFELYNELGQVGFKLGKSYLHFGIAKVFFTKFTFDKNLLRLFLYGNGSDELLGKDITIDKNGLNITSYHQFALGYSFSFSEKFTVGLKAKYLNGAFNVWAKEASFTL